MFEVGLELSRGVSRFVDVRALLRYRFYAKLSKCAFNRAKMTFLRFVIEKNDIQMKQSRIDVIAS